MKPQASAGVIRWLDEADEDLVFISVISIAEISRGIERMSKGQRRERISAWLNEDLPARFENRILPIDAQTAHHWGVIVAAAQGKGIIPGAMDAFLAATASLRSLTLVTRNTKHFRQLGIALLDPWTNSYFDADSSA